MSLNVKSTKHFNIKEFEPHSCKDHLSIGYIEFNKREIEKNLARLMQLAEDIREIVGEPMIITSGLRGLLHNKSVGGVYNSHHLLGNAFDFTIKGDVAKAYVKIINSDLLYAECFYYKSHNFIHIAYGSELKDNIYD